MNDDLALKLAEIGKSLVEIASTIASTKKEQPEKTVEVVAKPKKTRQNKKPVTQPNTSSMKKKNTTTAKNKWKDDGTLFAELKGKTPPAAPRTPRPSNLREVTCSACGKTEKKNINTIYSVAYRCDRCVLKGKV